VVVTVILTADIFNPCPSLHFKWLRPAVMVCRVRAVRRFFDLLLAIIPQTLALCIPITFCLSYASAIATYFFRDLVPAYSTPAGALYALLTLGLTTDNFDELLPRTLPWRELPALSLTYFLFFAAFLVVVGLFLVDLMLGLVYDTFVEQAREQVASERQKELKGLTLAFCTLDPENKGYIDEATWARFLEHFSPQTTPVDALFYFQIASNYTGELDLISFLDLKSHLAFEFRVSPSRRRSSLTTNRLSLHSVDAEIPSQFSVVEFGRWLKLSKSVRVFMDLAVVLDMLLCLANVEDLELSLLGFQLFLTPSRLFQLLYLLDNLMILEGFENRIGDFWEALDKHEQVALTGVIVKGVADALMQVFEWPWLLTASRLGRLVRCWRLVVLSGTLHSYVNTFFEVFPLYAETLGFAILIAYSFAMLGTVLFGFLPALEVFESPGRALRTMIQLFFDVDFGDIVDRSCAEVHPLLSPFIVAFFVAYRFIGVMIALNLVNAIIIQFYSIILEKETKKEEEQAAIDLIEQSLTCKCTEDRTISRWGHKLISEIDPDIKVVRAKSLTGADLRGELAAGGGGGDAITPEALKKCKKYAVNGADLDKAYFNKHYGVKAYREFEHKFTMLLRRERIGVLREYLNGDRIIAHGSRGKECFVAESGTVAICLADGTELLRKHAGEIFGEVSFLNQSARTSDVIAVGGGVKVRVFTTEDWLKMDYSIKGFFAQRIASLVMDQHVVFERQGKELAKRRASEKRDVHDKERGPGDDPATPEDGGSHNSTTPQGSTPPTTAMEGAPRQVSPPLTASSPSSTSSLAFSWPSTPPSTAPQAPGMGGSRRHSFVSGAALPDTVATRALAQFGKEEDEEELLSRPERRRRLSMITSPQGQAVAMPQLDEEAATDQAILAQAGVVGARNVKLPQEHPLRQQQVRSLWKTSISKVQTAVRWKNLAQAPRRASVGSDPAAVAAAAAAAAAGALGPTQTKPPLASQHPMKRSSSGLSSVFGLVDDGDDDDRADDDGGSGVPLLTQSPTSGGGESRRASAPVVAGSHGHAHTHQEITFLRSRNSTLEAQIMQLQDQLANLKVDLASASTSSNKTDGDGGAVALASPPTVSPEIAAAAAAADPIKGGEARVLFRRRDPVESPSRSAPPEAESEEGR